MSTQDGERALKIAELEAALKLPLPDTARQYLEASLRELGAIAPLPTAPDIGSPASQGTTYINGTLRGTAIGVNGGTVQVFFGASPPADAKELLENYLRSLIAEYTPLRLGKLLGKEQSARGRAAMPSLSLCAVYTSLATNMRIHTADFRLDCETLQNELRASDPARVLPDQVRLAVADMPQVCGRTPLKEAGAPEITTGWLADQWQASWRATTESQAPKMVISGGWFRPELAVEAIAALPRLVLLGDPGCGKSTILRYLIVSLAQALLAGRDAGTELHGWERVAPLPIPLFCQLGRVARAFDTDPDHDLDVLTDVMLRPVVGPGALRQELRKSILQAWRDGGVLFCLDGLDEVSGVPEPTCHGRRSRRERIAEVVRQLGTQLGRARITVTCRTRPYQQDTAWQLPEHWLVRTIEPFAFGQVRYFVPTWYAETCASTEAARYTPDQAEMRATALLDAIANKPGLLEITTSPLLQTMLALLHYNQKQLPDERADVYEELVKLLLERWEGLRSDERDRRQESFGEHLGLPHLRADDLRPALHALAFRAHQQSLDRRGVISEAVLHETLDDFFRQEIDPNNPHEVRRSEVVEKSERFTQLLVSETGLVQPDADGVYVLPHLTFEEYLAGCHLAGRGDVRVAYEQWCAAGERWREALLLMVGRLRQQEKFNDILAWLTLLLAEKETPAQRQRDALLAAACYADLGRRRYLGRYLPQPAVLEIERKLQARLREGLEQPALPLAQRVEAGEALGHLGDSRMPITGENWQAELARRNQEFGASAGYWCYMRPGTYQIGGWEHCQKAANATLAAFWIARFPITVAQYAPFIAMGYTDDAKRWWTSNGWQWRKERAHTQPWSWNEAPYNSSNQPVIGVTWYEANAFCAWLTEQLVDTLPTGYVVRLPTEAEWEAAAAYDAVMMRCSYPWGEEQPTPERAIYDASNLGRPAPVGCCMAGAAACGALDMIGNVWEITASSYRSYPARSHEVVEDFTVDANDVPWRGCGWGDNSMYASCEVRDALRPGRGFSYVVGFRVLLASRSHNPCGQRAAHLAETSGTTIVSTTNVSGRLHGSAIGVNLGTVQTFFGAAPPASGQQSPSIVSQEEIKEQHARLEAHRRTLAIYLTRLAKLGSANTPPEVFHGIREARDAIRHAKAALRGWGEVIDDHPNDESVT